MTRCPPPQVPFVVLNLRRAARLPLTTGAHATLGALRTTSFLASFVALYQGAVGVHRKLVTGSDSKYLYYVAGALREGLVSRRRWAVDRKIGEGPVL